MLVCYYYNADNNNYALTIDCTLLFSPFVSAAQNGNTRVQPIMLTKLSGIDKFVTFCYILIIINQI